MYASCAALDCHPQDIDIEYNTNSETIIAQADAK
jgi:DNA-binding Xre family transcriptional regulator